jgi:hypothetical protein
LWWAVWVQHGPCARGVQICNVHSFLFSIFMSPFHISRASQSFQAWKTITSQLRAELSKPMNLLHRPVSVFVCRRVSSCM